MPRASFTPDRDLSTRAAAPLLRSGDAVDTGRPLSARVHTTPRPHPQRRLYFSISGLSRATTGLVTDLATVAIDAGFSPALVLTAHATTAEGDNWRLADDDSALDCALTLARTGSELLLGGLRHDSAPDTRGRSMKGVAGWGSIAGIMPGAAAAAVDKGEFHRIAAHETRLRVTAAHRQLSALGLFSDVLAPAKWYISQPALEAVVSVAPQLGLRAVADAYSIIGIPPVGTGALNVVAQRVFAMGEGFGAGRWWRQHIGSTVAMKFDRGEDIRLSIDAAKAENPAVRRDMVSLLQGAHAAGYSTARYGDVGWAHPGMVTEAAI